MVTLSLRTYQSQCVEKSREKNIIVNLPTGHGKTLVAVQRVDDTLPRKVGFLVPTRALVEQQSDYIAKYSSKRPRITKLVGEDQSAWDKSDWDECIRHTDVFVGTAAVFTKAIVIDRFLHLRLFGLLIFDECHNAVGNSPMASLMRDAVVPYYIGNITHRRDLFILGLTASFVNGSLKNLEKKRRDLEALMQSEILCPDTTNKIPSKVQFHEVPWLCEDIEEHIEIISRHVEESIRRVGRIKEIEKVINRCVHIFEELGRSAMLYFVRNVIVRQILDKVNQLKGDTSDLNRQLLAQSIARQIPRIQMEAQSLLLRLELDAKLATAPLQNHKLTVLISLLKKILTFHGAAYRGIVFVEQVALVSPLANALNESMLSAGAIAGTGHQADKEREMQLNDFRVGKIFILVSTAALEEGIDVPECSFVVRYSKFTTTKSHIQGSGRARSSCGNIYYFANAVAIEKFRASSLEAMAKETLLSLDRMELQSKARSMGGVISGRHPYPFDTSCAHHEHGIVNVFNCKQVFNQYCSKVLGRSISPAHYLYTFDSTHTSIEKVRFPTPQGWLSINLRQTRQFWANTDLKSLFPKERSKNLNRAEKAEACIVYFAVVELREMKLLNAYNQPVVSAADINHVCSLSTSSDVSINIKSLVLQSRRPQTGNNIS